MRLDALDRGALRRLDEALRRGEPCHLELKAGLPRSLRADQVIPLFDSVRASTAALTRTLEGHLPPAGREGEGPHVSVVIPTNRHSPIALRALRAQDCRVEVLVLANGGAQVEGDRVLRVPWTGHGPTRMEGVRAAAGDYVLLTVDDALPRGRGCLRRLVEALEEGGYDAVFGRQLPWPRSSAITRRRLAEWTPSGRGHWQVERLDHVFALYRKETLLRHPLPNVPIGEDLHWRQGRRIGYVPGAPVVHAHDRRPGELYRRTRDLHLQHLLLGDGARVPNLRSLLGALPSALEPVLRSGPRELPNQLAELLGQWRAARLGPRRR